MMEELKEDFKKLPRVASGELVAESVSVAVLPELVVKKATKKKLPQRLF